MSQRNATRTYSAVQIASAAVGAVFLLVGILGFIPGVTTDYDMLAGAGHHSGAMLFGIFEVSVLHDVVHLLFGVAGLAMARMARTAQLYLVGGGIVYLALWIYGLVIDKDSSANFVPVNDADNWLHLVLGLGMVALGILTPRIVRRGTTGSHPHR
jgi:4-hydroxybenzoate polyprenyltransferase